MAISVPGKSKYVVTLPLCIKMCAHAIIFAHFQLYSSRTPDALRERERERERERLLQDALHKNITQNYDKKLSPSI